MSTNCDVIVIFPIYGQSGAIRKPDSGPIVCTKFQVYSINLTRFRQGGPGNSSPPYTHTHLKTDP